MNNILDYEKLNYYPYIYDIMEIITWFSERSPIILMPYYKRLAEYVDPALSRYTYSELREMHKYLDNHLKID